MLSCRYRILSLNINDLPLAADIVAGDDAKIREIVIKEEQTVLLPRIVKQNALLFQAMEHVRSKKKTDEKADARPGHDVITRFENDVCVLRWSQQASANSEFLSKDGKTVFSVADVRKHMLESGFSLGGKKMLPAMASASATRSGEYLFLSEGYRDEVVKETTLGILSYEDGIPKLDIDPEHQVYISKLIAYIGNACSDGVSLQELVRCGEKAGEKPEPFSFTEKNVIVVSDVNPKDVKNPLCDFRIRGDQNGVVSLERFPEKGAEINLSDGYGFISTRMMDKINALRKIRKPSAKPVSAIIVRWPFVKGMLLAVDLEKYFCEKHPGKKVKDKYGGEHDVKDLDIVLTQSMFKGYTYFEHLSGKKSGQEGWNEYMSRLNQSGLSMVIVGSDTPPTELTKTNYQLLSTLMPDKETLDELSSREKKLREELEKALNDGESDVKTLVKLLRSDFSVTGEEKAEEEGSVDDGEGEQPDDAGEDRSYSELLADLVEAYPELGSCTHLIRSELYDRIVSQAMDAAHGRLTVKGDMRILCNDPFLLLEKMVDGKAEHGAWPINGEGVFYAPGLKAKKAVIERNPHVSPMEDCLVEALPETHEKYAEYEKHFGTCTGVVLCPGIVASAIAGADYDGDRVRLVCEDKYIKAVEKNIRKFYGWLDENRKKDEKAPAYGSIRLLEGEKLEKEKQKIYPPVEISPPQVKGSAVNEILGENLKRKMVDTYLDSIDSRVGQFSNFAVAVAMEQPGAGEELDWAAKLAAWCVQIGLDIDSVKTGEKVNPPKGMRASAGRDESDGETGSEEAGSDETGAENAAEFGVKKYSKPALLCFVSGVKNGRRDGKKREALFAAGMNEGGSRGGSPLNGLPDMFDIRKIRNPAAEEDENGKKMSVEKELRKVFPFAQEQMPSKYRSKKIAQTLDGYAFRRTLEKQISVQIDNVRNQRLNIYKYLLKQYSVEKARTYYQQILQAKDTVNAQELMNDESFADYAYHSAEEIKKDFSKMIFGDQDQEGFEYDVTALTLLKHISRYKGACEALEKLKKQKEEKAAGEKTVSLITGGLRHELQQLAEKNNTSMGTIGRMALDKGWVDGMYFVILFADALIQEKRGEQEHVDA